MRAMLVTCAMVLAGGGSAAAEPPPKDPVPQVKVLRGKDGRITYRFKGLILYGKAHRPHAVLMLHRDRDLYRSAVPHRKPTRRIPAALRRSPF